MADTPQEIVERELREFRRYTGDGLPGEPVNAPLPVGDPQSGVHNPKKVNLRKAMLAPVEAAAQSASDAKDEADRAEGEANRAESEADRAENAASSFIEVATNFKTVAALQGDETMGYAGSGKDVIVGEGDIVTAQGFRYEVAASGATDAHVETAGGVKLRVLPLGDRMYAAAFGIPGDGSDQTALLKALFAAGAGYEIRLGRAQTYLSTEGLQLVDDTTLDLRGSTINFDCQSDRDRNLEIWGDNVRVHGGAVRNISGIVGYEGSMQTPITIARFQELTGFENIVIEDMTIETMSADGNGIAICGDSKNIDIRRIQFPNNAFIGRPIMSHWSFNAAVVNGGGQRVTSHQKNIRISNIWCGTLSRLIDPNDASALFGQSVVFLSAVYSAEVSNIICTNFSRGKAVTVYAGDWGFQFAQGLNEEELGSRSISVRNVWGRYFNGIEVYMKNTLGEPLVSWPSQVVFEGVNVLGYGAVAQTSKGFVVAGAADVTIRNSCFDGYYDGGSPSSGTTRFALENSTIKNSRRYGLLASTDASDMEDWKIQGNLFADNNKAEASNIADLYINKIAGAHIDGNTFDSPLCANNVRTQGGANRPTGLKIRDNHTVRNPTSTLYALGASGDTDIAEVFDGNTCETAPSAFKSGQLVIGAATSVSSAPLFIGQQAIIPGGNAYIATGTSSAADWKQITN